MTRRLRHLIAALGAALLLLGVPAAQADPVSDCADNGSIDGSYSDSELRGALGNIPADLDEYSDCRGMISGLIGGPGARKSSPGPGTGGGDATPLTPQQKAKVKAKQKAKAKAKARKKARELAAVVADDGGGKGLALNAADTTTGMPTGLIIALIALSALALLGGILTLSRRVPAFGDRLRRVPRPRGRR